MFQAVMNITDKTDLTPVNRGLSFHSPPFDCRTVRPGSAFSLRRECVMRVTDKSDHARVKRSCVHDEPFLLGRAEVGRAESGNGSALLRYA